DPFGNWTRYERDERTLAPTQLTDARRNTTRIAYDPWTLLPQQTTDANGTVREVSYDPLGRVHLSRLRGTERAFTDSRADSVG
ncbi:hypothetical protein, partial [Burkholderia sp. GbtcB21]|uniref:hypothetical protein n=1 Tax=Burkholderia sp. GbtcB21 TaxID=2824766 RepID=UPI001C3033CE